MDNNTLEERESNLRAAIQIHIQKLEKELERLRELIKDIQ